MTNKIYKTALGKTIDMGSLILQNEGVRAVGNMNVNARGDVVDGADQVIDRKNKQLQRQYKRQSTPPAQEIQPLHTSTRAAKQAVAPVVTETVLFGDKEADDAVEQPTTGLAAAMARANKSTEE
jgi:hypothetical protein